MRARGIALAVAIALAGGPLTAKDSALDQAESREELFGWEAVGRLDTSEGGFCTGVLIDTDLVLTAAHCLFDLSSGEARPLDPAGMTFRAGLVNDRAVAERRVVQAVAHPSYEPGPEPTAASVRSDIALLKLAEPIPAAIAAPFRVGPLAAGARGVAVASYAAGRSFALSVQDQCRVLGREPGLFAFTCDVDHGSSGAPVFDASTPRRRVVSLISAGHRDDKGVVAIGVELSLRVDEVRRHMQSGGGVRATARTADTGPRLGGASRLSAGGARFVKPPSP